MGLLSTNQVVVTGLLRRANAPDQAGLFDGQDPTAYNASDPIRLWIIQVAIIIGITQLLALILGKIRQPRVIAEVIGGVILGPSVMGHIPGFTQHIFPTQSIPLLNLTANIGLVLFLFLIGLEVDFSIVRQRFKVSASISGVGLIIPLGLGAALGVPLYHQFTDQTVNYGYFLLFVAVAIGITAFPVLCRILTALKLLDTTVGAVTLAAGVGNDIVGWILLALTVALVNSGNGITALWVLLTAVGFVIFMAIPVRLSYRWLARYSGSLETGHPTALMMTLTIIILFGSAFFTDVIGIHAIFGGFLAGLIIPHDNGYAINVVEKLEDLVSIVFLPLYFAFTGINTNLSTLNTGTTWGYVVLICVVAFFSKFLGCAITAKLFGFTFRESGAIGALMSCKGLVELIVLNVGLSAGILDTRTFSMFVVHALVLTFMTTPLTILIYPSRFYVHEGIQRGATTEPEHGTGVNTSSDSNAETKTKLTVVLDRIEQLPAIMTLTQMLQPPLAFALDKVTSSSIKDEKASVDSFPPGLSAAFARQTFTVSNPRISVNALRLIELTERTSALLKSQTAETLVHRDPVLSILRTFGFLNHMNISTALSIIPYEEFSSRIVTHAGDTSSQMVVVPWNLTSVPPGTEDSQAVLPSSSSTGPFDGIFSQKRDENTAYVHAQYVRKVFAESPSDVALIVDRGSPLPTDNGLGHHLFLPFFGGPDDRLALSLVVQICMTPAVTATVIRMKKSTSDDIVYNPTDTEKIAKPQAVQDSTRRTVTFPDTVYGTRDTQTRLNSIVADDLIWARYTSPNVQSVQLADVLSRIDFREESHPRALSGVVDAATRLSQEHTQKRLFFVAGRSRHLAVDSTSAELKELCAQRGATLGQDTMKSFGDVGAALAASSSTGNLLILQAA